MIAAVLRFSTVAAVPIPPDPEVCQAARLPAHQLTAHPPTRGGHRSASTCPPYLGTWARKSHMQQGEVLLLQGSG